MIMLRYIVLSLLQHRSSIYKVAGEWYWESSDGKLTKIAVTNWDWNQPDNNHGIGGGQNCIQTWWWKPKWDDIWCDAKRRFICEKEV